MGKIKKKVKKRPSFIYEGDREFVFLKYLDQQYKFRVNKFLPTSGGTGDSIVSEGLRFCNTLQNLNVLFDEDFEINEHPISNATLNKLQQQWCTESSLIGIKYRDLESRNIKKKNPQLIVSYPKSIDGLILWIYGFDLKELEPKTTQNLKGVLNALIDKEVTSEEIEQVNPNLRFTNNQKKFLCFLNKNNFLDKMQHMRATSNIVDALLKVFED